MKKRVIIALALLFSSGVVMASAPCDKLLLLWQSFYNRILKDEDYASSRRLELQARLGRPQEFIARKKIDTATLQLDKPFTNGSDNSHVGLVVGRWEGQRVLVKFFWRSPQTLDRAIGGAIIQDFLSEMDIASKVHGIILDADKIKELKKNSSVAFMTDKEVLSDMYMAMVMEYIPDNFNVPHGRFMPAWYTALDRQEVKRQIIRLENVLSRLGIIRHGDPDFLVTPAYRIYAVGFEAGDFQPERAGADASIFNYSHLEGLKYFNTDPAKEPTKP